MHRILALLLSVGSFVGSPLALCASSSSFSILAGNYTIIGFSDDKHYVILNNNKIFKAIDSESEQLLGQWTNGASVRLIPQNKSKIYALVNLSSGETISIKHKHHLP